MRSEFKVVDRKAEMSEKPAVDVVVGEIRDMRRLRHIHWRAPTMMGASYLCGFIVIGLHHGFYLLMNGEPASNALLQSWVNRAGTALAFFARLCLAVGTGVAYDQWMWVDLRAKPHDMKSLDAMFSVLGNSFEFFRLGIWFRKPALAFIAAVTWLLPISAVFTPGTLSVQAVLESNNQSLHISERAYTTNSDIYCGYGTDSDGNTTSYVELATGLFIPTMGTVLNNGVLPVQPSTTNLTYHLQFYAPAVRCNQSSDEDFQNAQRAILEYENSTSTKVFYMGWVPQPGWGPEVNGSFFASDDVQLGNIRLDFVSQDAARMFIYLNTTGYDSSGNPTPFNGTSSAQMITCALYNASYDASFEVNSTGMQRVSASTTFQNWMPAFATVPGTAQDPLVSRQMNMQAVMEVFGMMLVGPITFGLDGSRSITSVYALQLNQEMYPADVGENQTALTQRQMLRNEAMFRNITLSMLFGLVNGRSGENQIDTPAVSQYFESQFVYEPRTLLIAYGVSVLFALVCILMGVHALLHNGASYTNSFSTIVRVTRDPALSRLIADEGDRQGAEPVPKHVRRVVLRLGRSAKVLPSYSPGWI